MKVVALLSGGLDSTLAIKVILEQGIEVIALNFTTPFCLCNRRRGSCGGYEAKKVADKFGIKLKVFNLGEEYLEVVRNPKHGYGKNLNPCIDCRILIQMKAKEYMKEVGASFLITGEVLGQRPMSQHKIALKTIEKESGLEGLVLRPLSAKLLPETIPEKNSWVDRMKLLDISGRSRKPQIAKALEYGISDYPCPAGGCLLTDLGFSRRMRDLLKYTLEPSLNDIELLKFGRHFRISRTAKLIVGRDKEENESLTKLAKEGDFLFWPIEIKGPIGVGRGIFEGDDIDRVARIIARYSDGRLNTKITVSNQILPDGKESLITAVPLSDMELEELRI
jgi:tRNA U34 2-thiouridine synthase MnmA/TrmU